MTETKTTPTSAKMLRGSGRSLQENKAPLNPDKDAAQRPFDPAQTFKGTDTFRQRPSRISYFPDQVFQISYVVSVKENAKSSISRSNNHAHSPNVLGNSLAMADLGQALDQLASELAPEAYPQLWVREITTSIDGFIPAVCPENTNLRNCQDITSSIGIYLSEKPNRVDGDDISEVENLYGPPEATTKNKQNIDAAGLNQELLQFQSNLADAIANNRLQDIIDGYYNNDSVTGVEPPIYVIPTEPVTTSGGSVGGVGNDENNNSDNEEGEEPNENNNVTDEDEEVENENESDGNDATDENGENENVLENEENGGGDDGSGSGSNGNDGDSATGSGTDAIDQEDEETSGSGNTSEEPIDEDPSNNGDNNEGPNNDVEEPPTTGNPGSDVNDEEDDSDGDNFQIGTGGGESAPIPDKEVISSEEEDSSGSGGDASDIGDQPGDSSGGSSGSDNNSLPWVPDEPSDTTTGESALPANGVNAVQSNGKDGLSTGAIVGIALGALAAILIVCLCCCLRRKRRKNTRSRGASSSSKNKKSMNSDVYGNDSVSDDSSKKNSLGRFLYSGVQGGTNHSRNTAPTVAASSSSLSGENSNHSGSAMDASRGLLVLDRVEEEKHSEDEDNDPNDPLLGLGAVSDLYVPPSDGEVFEMEACVALSSSSSSSGGSIDENVEEYVVTTPASSRRSSRGSSTGSESPLKAMAARSIRALRRNSRGSDGRTRSIEKSKQELEDVLNGGGFQTNDEEDDLEVIRMSDGTRSADVNSPANARPLSSLDEAIMKGDWAAVGATAALMAASISPEDKAKRPQKRRPSLTSPPPEKAELDQLIEAGDWQAVMIAAAQYDASSQAESANRSRTSTQGSDTMDDSYYSGADHSSAYNSYTRGSVHTSNSQKERVEEIRTQVEQLVRDVVPDEAENVDEMMSQFKGKEEELLETLRTMKERDVAKKARMESQKIARRNTRSREKEEAEKAGSSQATESDLMVHTAYEVTPKKDPPASDSGGDDSSDYSPEPAATPEHGEGSFDQSIKGGDKDAAAAAAAAWAIERSLNEMMEKKQKVSTDQEEPRFLV